MDDVLNSRQGDCKDQAGLMIALLREMGIPAHFALVNARYVNTVGFLPSTRFTHAVVRTRASDGTEYWLDPTIEDLALPNIPMALEGMQALVIDSTIDTPFVRIPSDALSSEGTTGTATARMISPSEFEFTLTTRSRGDHGADIRAFARAESTMVSSMLEQLLGEELSGAELESWRVLQNDPSSNEVAIEMVLRTRLQLAQAGSMRVLSVPWIAWTLPKDIVARPARNCGIEVSGWRGEYRAQVVLPLPEGASLVDSEEPVRLESRFGAFEVSRAMNSEGQLVCTKSFTLRDARIELEDYADFRDFMLAAIAAEEEQIVLRGWDD